MPTKRTTGPSTRRKIPEAASEVAPEETVPPAQASPKREGINPAVLEAMAQARRSSASDMEDFTPELGSTAAREPTTKVPPPPPFFLVMRPGRFEAIGGRVVPALHKLTIRAGSNGVQTGPDGAPLMAAALAQAQENGDIVVPHSVDGPNTSYLKRDRRTGGVFTKWEQVFVGSRRIRVDEDGYAAKLVEWMERGILPRPDANVLEGLMDRYRERHAQYSAQPGKYGPHLEKATRALETIASELARLQEIEDSELAPTDMEDAVISVDTDTKLGGA